MRVLVTTAPLHGHFFPMVPLAAALRGAGHEVLVGSTANFLDDVAAAGLPATAIGPATEFGDFMFRDRQGRLLSQPADPAVRRASSGRAWGRLAARTLAGTLDLVRVWRPDLVITEPTEYAGMIAAAVHDVPLVEHGWGLAVQPEYRPAAEDELAPEREPLGLAALPAADLRIDLAPVSLQEPGPGGQPMRYVPYNGTAVLPDWVWRPRSEDPDRRARVCLTLGSMLPRYGLLDFAGMLREQALAVAELGVEVVVAVDDAVAACWEPMPETVLAAGWLPMDAVLANCDAVVHHGGPGSLFTALARGVPQLALPQTADQFDNSARLVEAGAGLRLFAHERPPAAVAQACRSLLAEPRFRKSAADLAAENAERPSPADVVGVLERLAGKKRSRS
jgi:UDP:flavonoid glycosyltransferase YjiC (YdhE family)